MDAAERMSILHHDREVRKEKMLRQMVCYMTFKLVSEKKPLFLLYSQIISDTKCLGFPPHTRSLTPAECPTIQFSSDTIYLELVSDPTC